MKRPDTYSLICLISIAVAFFAGSCGGAGAGEDTYTDAEVCDTLTHHSRLLCVSERSDGVVLADISNPWRQGQYLGRYALVHVDSVLPADLPPYAAVIRTPVARAAVFSSVHTSALCELGALGMVAAVADGRYFPPADTVSVLLRSGRITDVGTYMQPSAELLVQSGSRVVLNSPMPGAMPVLPPSVTCVPMADYMESSPIGRAEWIILLGELSGKRAEAMNIFDGVIERYTMLHMKASAAASPRPKVMADTEQSGVWYVASGDSYMARMLADAGAVWPWADVKGTDALPLGMEDVAARALDADIWLIRNYGGDITAESLAGTSARVKAFKAWKDGKIYVCNTARDNIFDITAFHPDAVLAEYVSIFHPEVLPDYEPRYFHAVSCP